MLTWNMLGVLLWVMLILYLIFVVQNIRQRRIRLLIKQQRRFSWGNLGIDVIELVVLVMAFGSLINAAWLDNPNLEDRGRIFAKVTYRPLIVTTDKDSGQSNYVAVSAQKTKHGSQTYTVYVAGKRLSLPSTMASIADDVKPLAVDAQHIPYDKTALVKMDHHFQKAYLAEYRAWYRENWQNGLGLHAGQLAMHYYLVRVPDQSFVVVK